MALGSVCGIAAVPGPSSAEARAGLILRICASLVLQKSRFSPEGPWPTSSPARASCWLSAAEQQVVFDERRDRRLPA
eukprot:247630-Prymnesium_polylepis.1